MRSSATCRLHDAAKFFGTIVHPSLGSSNINLGHRRAVDEARSRISLGVGA